MHFLFFVYLGTRANIKRRRYYPPDIKRVLYAMCLERSAPGMLQEGVTKSVARDMEVPLRVVQRVWRDGKTGGGVSAFDSNKKKNCGPKKLAFNPDVIKDVPLRERHTIRDLANALHMSKSTLHRSKRRKV
jgi:transposase-like protein